MDTCTKILILAAMVVFLIAAIWLMKLAIQSFKQPTTGVRPGTTRRSPEDDEEDEHADIFKK
jgi:uncharacterized membrane protein YqiK